MCYDQAYAAGAAKGVAKGTVVTAKVTGKVVVATGKVTVKVGTKVGNAAVKAGGQAARQIGKAAIKAEKIVLKQVVQETSKSGKIITKVITKAWNGSSGDANAEIIRLQQLGQAAMDYFASGEVKDAGIIEKTNGIVRLVRRKLSKNAQNTNDAPPAGYDAATTESTTENASAKLIGEIKRGRIDGEVWDDDSSTPSSDN